MLMELLNLLKGKLWLIISGAFALLLGWVKYLTVRNTRLKTRAKRAEAQKKFDEKVATIDEQIEQDFAHRAELANSDKTKVPDNLSDPSNF